MAEMTLTFGKYSGKKLNEVPVSYVQWLSEQSTICGKTIVPQAAKSYLASLSGPVAQGKYCMSCRQEIIGEAIPVQDSTSYGWKTTNVKTRYLCSECANHMAEED